MSAAMAIRHRCQENMEASESNFSGLSGQTWETGVIKNPFKTTDGIGHHGLPARVPWRCGLIISTKLPIPRTIGSDPAPPVFCRTESEPIARFQAFSPVDRVLAWDRTGEIDRPHQILAPLWLSAYEPGGREFESLRARHF